MKIQTLVQGSFQTNSYLVSLDDEVLLIDPTGKADKLIQAIAQAKVVGILLTHGHFDHIGAVDTLAEYYKCPVYIHPRDVELAQNSRLNALGAYAGSINVKTVDIAEGTIMIGTFKIEILETPGHTEGSVIYLIENAMFSGDTLFKQSVGRTDLYGGDMKALKQSLAYIKTLSYNYTIYPGHDVSTTLDDEKQFNPYLNKA